MQIRAHHARQASDESPGTPPPPGTLRGISRISFCISNIVTLLRGAVRTFLIPGPPTPAILPQAEPRYSLPAESRAGAFAVEGGTEGGGAAAHQLGLWGLHRAGGLWEGGPGTERRHRRAHGCETGTLRSAHCSYCMNTCKSVQWAEDMTFLTTRSFVIK